MAVKVTIPNFIGISDSDENWIVENFGGPISYELDRCSGPTWKIANFAICNEKFGNFNYHAVGVFKNTEQATLFKLRWL